MSKAIMIVDLPDFCTADCPLYFNCHEEQGFYCKRPSTCILFPVPEKVAIQTTDSNYTRGYCQAVNDFVDQLSRVEKMQTEGRYNSMSKS